LEDVEEFEMVEQIALKGTDVSPAKLRKFGAEDVESLTPVETSIALWRWVGMTCFQMVYSSINTGMAIFVLPLEAERLNHASSSVWLGVYLAACGLTQVICPIAGKVSDNHASRNGRRYPFIKWGCIVATFAFGGLWISSLNLWRFTYIFCLLVVQLALNVVYSAQCGLPVDMQEDSNDESTSAIVSGVIAVHGFAGALVAMGFATFGSSLALQAEYPRYMVMLAITVVAVGCSARERPTDKTHPGGWPSRQEMLSTFRINLNDDIDFFWVCVGRMQFYVSTSCTVFMLYYLRDMLGIKHEADRKEKMGILGVSAQIMGAVAAIPFSRLSNTMGRKAVINISCMVMVVTFALYVAAPKVVEGGSWPLVLTAGLVYGMGSGAYLSVDYALAMDCLPKGKTVAEAFGLWGIAGFLGSTVGPTIGGLLLAFNKRASDGQDPVLADPPLPRVTNDPKDLTGGPEDEYSFLGYALVMICLGIFMNIMVMIVTAKIKKAK
jgi:MFS family permease